MVSRRSWLPAKLSDVDRALSAALASAGLTPPLHAGTRAKPYDARNSVYNWKPANTRKLRTILGQGSYFTTRADVVAIGDSVTEGQIGASTWNAQFAWPTIMKNCLVAGSSIGQGGAGGCIDGGTGVHFGSAATASFDTRVSKTGTWTNNVAGYVSGANGATMTYPFTTLAPVVVGTCVDVAYEFVSGSGFTVAIDGGAPVQVPMTGSGFKHYTVTGLTDGPHSVVITVNTATAPRLIGINVYRTYGLMVHNMARAGSTAQQWADPASGGVWDYRVASLPPSTNAKAAFIKLGANDLAAGRSISQIKADIIAVRNRLPGADAVLLNYAEAGTGAFLTGSTFAAYNKMLYDVADQLDVPLIDALERTGGFAVADANGIMAADMTHPTTKYQADLGRAVARLISS